MIEMSWNRVIFCCCLSYGSSYVLIFTLNIIQLVCYQLQVLFIGQFLVAARSVWLFDDKQNVSSSGAQGKQSSNCVMSLQWPVLGKVPACGVWFKLKLV